MKYIHVRPKLTTEVGHLPSSDKLLTNQPDNNMVSYSLCNHHWVISRKEN